jgi:hypothetical protein
MRRLLGWLFRIALVVIVGAGLTAMLARLGDGPFGPFPGGPFRVAAEDEVPLDPSAAAKADTIEIEVGEPSPKTRTTWVLVHENHVFVPAGAAAYKSWPAEAEAEGHMRVRIGGLVSPVEVRRVDDPALRKQILRMVAEKYGLEGDEDGAMAESTWIFRLYPAATTPYAD